MIYKDLFKIYLKLSSKIHDNLSNLRYKYLFATNLKYAYLIILLHLDNRYYFAFTILEIK